MNNLKEKSKKDIIFYNKYKKYKQKYLELKGGSCETQMDNIIDVFHYYITRPDSLITEDANIYYKKYLNLIYQIDFFDEPMSMYGGDFKVYKQYFNNFNTITPDTPDYANLKKRYKELYNYHVNDNDDELNDYIKNSILKQEEFDRQHKYFLSLNNDLKYVYSLHKINASILVNVFRKKNMTELIDYIKSLYSLKFGSSEYTKSNLKILLFTQPLIEDITKEHTIPLFKILNFINIIYLNAPGIVNSFMLYRAERDYMGREDLSIGHNYKFNGYTSFSTDPRVGFTFNKVLNNINNVECSKSMDSVFRIKVPIGTKILIPAINKDIDIEFEILIKTNSEILIDNIINDTDLNIIEMYTNNNICVKVKKIIDGKLLF